MEDKFLPLFIEMWKDPNETTGMKIAVTLYGLFGYLWFIILPVLFWWIILPFFLLVY